MEKIESYFQIANPSSDDNYILILISFACSIITSLVIKFIYENKSNSLSSKSQIGNIIPVLSSLTFLIILVVKSSLALSLGLIGALSIVRFRTPVKEPEELIYLFFSIAVGIGYGAGQIILTSVCESWYLVKL